MDLKLQNKKALVISASKGIGKGVALALAKEGCHVLMTSSNRDNLEKAKAEIESSAAAKVDVYEMNVRSLDSVKTVSERILKEHLCIDILVTNGPGPDVTDAATVEESLLMNALVTNFVSTVTLCRIFLPAMIKQRFGRIIHLTSITAKEPDVGMVLSNVTRAAVMAYGKTLSREIAHHGITVNTILTGGVQTERTMQLRKIRAQKEGISYEEVVRQGSKNFPVGYIATPEQFSQAVVFLASPLSEYINGVSFPIDGGAMRSM